MVKNTRKNIVILSTSAFAVAALVLAAANAFKPINVSASNGLTISASNSLFTSVAKSDITFSSAYADQAQALYAAIKDTPSSHTCTIDSHVILAGLGGITPETISGSLYSGTVSSGDGSTYLAKVTQSASANKSGMVFLIGLNNVTSVTVTVSTAVLMIHGTFLSADCASDLSDGQANLQSSGTFTYSGTDTPRYFYGAISCSASSSSVELSSIACVWNC